MYPIIGDPCALGAVQEIDRVTLVALIVVLGAIGVSGIWAART